MEITRGRVRLLATLMLASGTLVSTQAAQAFRIELKDVAPDRIERQRAEAIGQIPLPGTPAIAQFEERLKARGLTMGSAVFIRTFKAESELEVWLQKGGKFEHFATYPICHWSGTLGPKITEGDKQTPEGVYTVALRQVHASARHPKALNLGFPNVLDRHLERSGSYILIHGGCGSVGCFGMTNPVIDEIFKLTQAALRDGQDVVHVHSFPFHMTDANLAANAEHQWAAFWRNLKTVSDAFERSRRVPKVTVCDDQYRVEPDEQPRPSARSMDLAGPLSGRPHNRCQPDNAAAIPVHVAHDGAGTHQKPAGAAAAAPKRGQP